ncbi:transcriptional repressor, partial [Candidatus Sumerlaeota bacterium]|nr:transcriptional repressor [Candidatus Sumerlaeota bacterium]
MTRALTALEEHFRMAFVGEGVADTREQRAVLRTFCQSDSHLTSDDLVEQVRRQGVEASPQTVRQVMSRLCDYGIAREVHTADGKTLYEHLHLDQHHDHLICTRCKRVMNFHDGRLEELKEAVARQRNFHPLRHRLEIYGLCNECLPTSTVARPLTEVAEGERVVVASLGGGRGFVRRLADLGVVPDAHLQVVNNAGAVIVA